jgi:hypothetical protein
MQRQQRSGNKVGVLGAENVLGGWRTLDVLHCSRGNLNMPLVWFAPIRQTQTANRRRNEHIVYILSLLSI